MAVLLSVFCFPGFTAQAQSTLAAPGTVFVKTALGGIIFGYDIDQSGTEGLLSEAIDVGGGKFNVATETFDQTTGKIVKIVAEQMNSGNDFVTFGIYGNGVGLFELEKVKGLFVDQRVYATMNPLSSNIFTAMWTPPLTTDQLIIGLAPSQGSPRTAVLAAENFNAVLFSSNVAENTWTSPRRMSLYFRASALDL